MPVSDQTTENVAENKNSLAQDHRQSCAQTLTALRKEIRLHAQGLKETGGTPCTDSFSSGTLLGLIQIAQEALPAQFKDLLLFIERQ